MAETIHIHGHGDVDDYVGLLKAREEAGLVEKPKVITSDEARAKGSFLVNWFAGISLFWEEAGNEGATPWSDLAESELAMQLFYLRTPMKPFLIGVMRELRGGKKAHQPLTLASGFMVLSSVSPTTVLSSLAGIDLRKTCDAGCQFGGNIVPRAATFAREQIYATD